MQTLAFPRVQVGARKVWLDPNEVNEISMANSRENRAGAARILHFMGFPISGHVAAPATGSSSRNSISGCIIRRLCVQHGGP